MSVEFPIVISNPLWPEPNRATARIAVREAYAAPATAPSKGMPIVHADKVSISDEAREAYQRLVAEIA
jgi:hypothetical protein